ncbi:MAG: cadherin repeat domain-containing protein, partial [Candidatus Portiera sp.]|nr:cadherin repeat domain-containing protein [Portiera sp.]
NNSFNSVQNVGAIAGLINNAKIYEVTSDVMISGSSNSSHLGGLVGRSLNSEISRSSSRGSISGSAKVGGLVGESSGSEISRSSSKGSVSGVAAVGGLVGRASDSNITLSYSSAAITGFNGTGGTGETWRNFGGLIGAMESSNLQASFAVGEISLAAAANKLENIGGLIGGASGSSVIDISYSGTSFIAPTNASVVLRNVGLIYGSLSSASRSDSSYSYSETPRTTNFSGDMGAMEGNFINNYYLGTEGTITDGLFSITKQQMQSCGLGGNALDGVSDTINCTGIFPGTVSISSDWGPRVINGVDVTWIFDPVDFYPRLNAFDLTTGEGVFPTPYEQHCIQGDCNVAERLSFSQEVYEFNISGNSNLGDMIGQVSAIPDSGAIYRIINQETIFAIDTTNGMITLNQGDVSGTHRFDVLVTNSANSIYDVASVIVRFLDNKFIPDADDDGIVDLYDTAMGVSGTDGEGTQGDPYVIKNIYQLQAISGFDHEGTPLNKSQHTSNSWLYGDNAANQLTKYYVLAEDIDASATRGWRTALKGESYVRGWRPLGDCSAFAAECPQPLNDISDDIGGFRGTFDGAGYTISSLYMDVKQTDGIGLFSALDGGSVANFKLDGVITANITTNNSFNSVQNVGAIAGLINNAKIYEVTSDVMISGSSNSSHLGGLVGRSLNSEISSSSSRGSISGSAKVGGLVGRSLNSEISRSSSNGSVSGVAAVGGLVGRASDSNITLSYSSVAITGVGGVWRNFGGLIGAMESSSLQASFAAGEISLATANNLENLENIGGLIGSVRGSSVIDISYSGTSFIAPNNASVVLRNVGLIYGSLSNTSRSDSSYSYSETPLITDFSGDMGDMGGNFNNNYYLGTEGTITDGLLNITKQQMQSCGLGGNALVGATDTIDCVGIFPGSVSFNSKWGPRVINGADISWVFDPVGFYPRLNVLDTTTNKRVFPTPYEQHCIQENCDANERLSFSQEVYEFDLSDALNFGATIGQVELASSTSVPASEIIYRTINIEEVIAVIDGSGNITLENSAPTGTYRFDVLVTNSANSIYDVASVILRFYINASRNDADNDGIVDLYDSAIQTPGLDGAGTQDDPYKIKNIYQLQAIAGVDHLGTPLSSSAFTDNKFIYGNSKKEQLTAHYQLANDIDAMSTHSSPASFIPIGDCGTDNTCRAGTLSENPFTGSFHGKGFVISNLLIDNDKAGLGRARLQPVGLFGQIDVGATITGVGLAKATINGWYITGGLVGLMNGGTISESHVINSEINLVEFNNTALVAPGFYGGGIVGLVHNGLLRYSYSSNTKLNKKARSSTTIIRTNNVAVGGLVGGLIGGYLDGVYSISNRIDIELDNRGASAGGLVGTIHGGSISGSYAVPNINQFRYRGLEFSTNDDRGGLVGLTIGEDNSIIDSYWFADTSSELEQSGIKTIPAGAKQQFLRRNLDDCPNIDCRITSVIGDFAADDIIFPRLSWGGGSSSDGLREIAWAFDPVTSLTPAYPHLSVANADGGSYLPNVIEQLCASDPNFIELCNTDNVVLPKFPQSHYSFIVNLDEDTSAPVGNVVTNPQASGGSNRGYAILADANNSAISTTSMIGIDISLSISNQFDISAEGNITFNQNNIPSEGIYVFQVISYIDVSTSSRSKVIYDSATLEILVERSAQIIANYTSATGSGTVVDPYNISNIYQLQAIAGVDHLSNPLDESPYTNGEWLYGTSAADQLTKHYKLTEDIDATETLTWNFDGFANAGFTPIGSCPTDSLGNPTLFACVDGVRDGPFRGSFDGNGKVIFALYLNGYDRDANGLFGGIQAAKVSNLRLYNAYVRTGYDTHNAILAGYALNSTIHDSSVEGTLDTWWYAGGLVGYARNSKIFNSFALANDGFFGVGMFGGLVGYLDNS